MALLLLLVAVVVVVVASFILSEGILAAFVLGFATALDTPPDDDDDDDDEEDARSFIKSRYASAKLAAWAGIIATPANIDAPTTNRPDTVIGDISPKPTVVNVVNPKYNAVK